MGIDERAVVDPALRVLGVDGLRVADASIMPSVTGGNTNAPAMMIGEHCAASCSRLTWSSETQASRLRIPSKSSRRMASATCSVA